MKDFGTVQGEHILAPVLLRIPSKEALKTKTDGKPKRSHIIDPPKYPTPPSPGLSSHNSTGMSDDDSRVDRADMNFDDFNATMVEAREFLAATTKAKKDSSQNETRFLDLQEARLKVDQDRQQEQERANSRMAKQVTDAMASNATVLQSMQQSSQSTAQGVADMGAGIRQLEEAAANAAQCKQKYVDGIPQLKYMRTDTNMITLHGYWPSWRGWWRLV